jgi:aminoglycoside phosphotransferase (APT) family kinase protein
MHTDELPIDEPLVRRLLGEQFPQWAELPLERIEPSGTVNAIYRLGSDLAIRLPRLVRWGSAPDALDEWLPRLAPLLRLEVPVPVARGVPAEGYPCHWSVVTWLEGRHGAVDPTQAATDLASFVAALQRAPAEGAPDGRGVPLERHDDQTRRAIAKLGDDPDRIAIWNEALAAPAWHGKPVWTHGDLDARNWLVRDGRISGVIDWGSAGVGDPAADVMVAWKLGSPEAREAFRHALAVDHATWLRARGWVLAQSQWALSYYTPENNQALYHEAGRWLDAVLADEGVEIVLADYDPAWPSLYAREEARIRGALGDRALLVEHVGSTAVPGLAAKPKIDVLLAVADSANEPAYVPALERAGYVLRIREPEWHEHRLFKGPDTNINLHVFSAGSPEIDRLLRFRDHLRRDANDRALYERTKRDLARKRWRVTQDYADAKSAVVEGILTRAS